MKKNVNLMTNELTDEIMTMAKEHREAVLMVGGAFYGVGKRNGMLIGIAGSLAALGLIKLGEVIKVRRDTNKLNEAFKEANDIFNGEES